MRMTNPMVSCQVQIVQHQTVECDAKLQRQSIWRQMIILLYSSNELATVMLNDIADAKWLGDGLLRSGGINKHAQRTSSNLSEVYYSTVATFCV